MANWTFGSRSSSRSVCLLLLPRASWWGESEYCAATRAGSGRRRKKAIRKDMPSRKLAKTQGPVVSSWVMAAPGVMVSARSVWARKGWGGNSSDRKRASRLPGSISAGPKIAPIVPAKTMRPIICARLAAGNISPTTKRLMCEPERAMPMPTELISSRGKLPCKTEISPSTAPRKAKP